MSVCSAFYKFDYPCSATSLQLRNAAEKDHVELLLLVIKIVQILIINMNSDALSAKTPSYIDV